ncbi:glycosyltransferase family 2 protein [soil metagenome]
MCFSVIARVEPRLDLSIVIPVRDEAENLLPLAREIDAAVAGLTSWECVWVDDGSADGTRAALHAVAAADARHRVLALSGGQGQSAALAAGFGVARGELLATLDGDGQSDPADLPRLIALLDEHGVDAVHGWRERRRDGWLRRFSSRVANTFRNRLTREALRDVGCSVRVLRREAVTGIPVFRGMHRFLPTLLRLNGYPRFLEVPVNHRARRSGRSKYGVRNRLWVGMVDTLAVRWMAARMTTPAVAAPSRKSPRLEEVSA